MEKVKRIQELRRSNAATAIPSKKKYSRKTKYKNKFDNQLKKSWPARACRPQLVDNYYV